LSCDVMADYTEIIRIQLEMVSNLKEKMDRDKAALASIRKDLSLLRREYEKYNSLIAASGDKSERFRNTLLRHRRILSDRISLEEANAERIKESMRIKKDEMSELQKKIDLTKKGVNVEQAHSKGLIGIKEALTMNFETWRYVNAEQTRNFTIGGKVANNVRMLTHGMRGFRMELLSVMFFGMALNRMFMGLIGPSLKATGVFSLMEAYLTATFLPTAEKVTGIIADWGDKFASLPEGIREPLGDFMLFAAIMGSILTLIGLVGLGLGGLINFFGPLVGINSVAEAWAAFGGVVGTVTGAIRGIISGPLIAAIILLYGAWIHNSEGISRALGELWSVFEDIFGNIIGIIGDVVGFIDAIFRGDANRAFEYLKSIAKRVIGIIITVFTKLPGAIFGVFYEIEWGIGKFVVTVVGTLYELGVKILSSLARGIISAYGTIKEAIRGIPFIGPIIAGGLDIVEGIGRGVASAIGCAIGGITSFVRGIIPFQHGGIVTAPTLAMVGEAGPEAIVPLEKANKVGATYNFNSTFNINATIANDMDVDELARRIDEKLATQYRRVSLG